MVRVVIKGRCSSTREYQLAATTLIIYRNYRSKRYTRRPSDATVVYAKAPMPLGELQVAVGYCSTWYVLHLLLTQSTTAITKDERNKKNETRRREEIIAALRKTQKNKQKRKRKTWDAGGTRTSSYAVKIQIGHGVKPKTRSTPPKRGVQH